MRILYAEDERDLNDLVTRRLVAEGYGVDSCLDGQQAWDYLQAADYDAAILDIMMPHLDGLSVLKKLRAAGKTTPVLLLTARDAIADRVAGLDSGAERLSGEALRAGGAECPAARADAFPVRCGRQQTRRGRSDAGHRARGRVKRGGAEIALSAREYALLEYLMHNKGIVLSREKIENHVWNFDYEGGTNVVDVYIRYLRKKIDDGHERKLIHTVRGMGYVLREETP